MQTTPHPIEPDGAKMNTFQSGSSIAAQESGGEQMLHWAWVFLVIALIAAVFGFGGIAASAAGIAKILFFVFLVLFVIGLLFGRRTVV